MDNYYTAFDLSQSGNTNWFIPLIGVAFGIWGWIVLSIYKAIQNRPQLESILSPFWRSKQIPR